MRLSDHPDRHRNGAVGDERGGRTRCGSKRGAARLLLNAFRLESPWESIGRLAAGSAPFMTRSVLPPATRPKASTRSKAYAGSSGCPFDLGKSAFPSPGDRRGAPVDPDLTVNAVSCPLLSGPSTMTVWIEEGTTNASEEAQARGEIFYSLAEARMLIEAWRRHYNTIRPHSSLGYRPPAPEAATPPLPASGSASLHLRPAMAAGAAHLIGHSRAPLERNRQSCYCSTYVPRGGVPWPISTMGF